MTKLAKFIDRIKDSSDADEIEDLLSNAEIFTENDYQNYVKIATTFNEKIFTPKDYTITETQKKFIDLIISQLKKINHLN